MVSGGFSGWLTGGGLTGGGLTGDGLTEVWLTVGGLTGGGGGGVMGGGGGEGAAFLKVLTGGGAGRFLLGSVTLLFALKPLAKIDTLFKGYNKKPAVVN